MIGVVIVASIVTTLNYAYRIAEHYTAVWGTVAGFARMHEAERSYRRSGHTGAIDYTSMQVLMPGIKVHSATTAHRNGVGRPYELQVVGGEQILTTVVDSEAQASQISERLGGKGTYTSESGGFRISYRPSRVDPLERLIQRHSMHVSGPHGSTLKDRLNFGPGAVVVVGDPCLPPDGIHSGGIAVDSAGRPVTCVRISPGTSILDREWRLVGSGTSPPVDPPLQETCGDGTVVSSRSTDCKDCPDGSNIVKTGACPAVTIKRCGDGTAVVDPAAECQDCWDDTNIHVADSCPAQPTEQCGDGTYVFDRETECHDCDDGSNIPITSTCPVPIVEYCGDGTLVTDRANECQDCWDGTNIHNSDSCPPLAFERCGDGTIVSDPVTDCKDCWDGSNIPLTQSCPDQPACGDGTLVTNPDVDCKDCVDGTNVSVSKTCPAGTECWDDSVVYPPDECPVQPTCGDGTRVSDPVTECKLCADGTSISVLNSCPVACPCGGGTVTPPDACPPISKKVLGPSSCPIDYARLVESSRQCDVTYSCQRNCPCEGGWVTHPATCPAVTKREEGPTTCPKWVHTGETFRDGVCDHLRVSENVPMQRNDCYPSFGLPANRSD